MQGLRRSKKHEESFMIVSKIVEESLIQRAAQSFIPQAAIAQDSLQKTLGLADSLAFICTFNRNEPPLPPKQVKENHIQPTYFKIKSLHRPIQTKKKSNASVSIGSKPSLERSSKNFIRLDLDDEEPHKQQTLEDIQKGAGVRFGLSNNLPKKKNQFYCIQDQVLDSSRDSEFSDQRGISVVDQIKHLIRSKQILDESGGNTPYNKSLKGTQKDLLRQGQKKGKQVSTPNKKNNYLSTDFHGSHIPVSKLDSHKIPQHFYEMEVSIPEQNQQKYHRFRFSLYQQKNQTNNEGQKHKQLEFNEEDESFTKAVVDCMNEVKNNNHEQYKKTQELKFSGPKHQPSKVSFSVFQNDKNKSIMNDDRQNAVTMQQFPMPAKLSILNCTGFKHTGFKNKKNSVKNRESQFSSVKFKQQYEERVLQNVESVRVQNQQALKYLLSNDIGTSKFLLKKKVTIDTNFR